MKANHLHQPRRTRILLASGLGVLAAASLAMIPTTLTRVDRVGDSLRLTREGTNPVTIWIQAPGQTAWTVAAENVVTETWTAPAGLDVARFLVLAGTALPPGGDEPPAPAPDPGGDDPVPPPPPPPSGGGDDPVPPGDQPPPGGDEPFPPAPDDPSAPSSDPAELPVADGHNHAMAIPDPGTVKLILYNNNSRLASCWHLTMVGTLKSYTLVQSSPITLGWQIRAIADVDGDGMLDLIMQNATTRMAVVWFLEKDGTLRSYQLIQETPITAGWEIKAAADIDKDGVPDLIMHNAKTRLAVIWFLNNDGTLKSFQLIQETPITAGWEIKAVSDVDGDGVPDLIMHNANTRLAVVWFLNDDGTLKSYQLIQETPITAGWEIRAVSDVDGDGVPDLVMQNANTRLAVVWFLNNTGTLKSFQLIQEAPITAGWEIKAAADVDGDSIPDLIMENANTRLAVIWFLNNDGTLKSYQLVQTQPITAGWTIRAAAN